MTASREKKWLQALVWGLTGTLISAHLSKYRIMWRD